MPTLSTHQIAQFKQDGYLFLEEALTDGQLQGLRQDFEKWKEESRHHSAPYGDTFDGRCRFDVEPGHSFETPALRRIASPIEISDIYLEVMRNNRALDALEDLLGPNIKFENAKINSKLPGAATEIKFHQDFLFEAHTNDDMVTVLFFLDDVTEETGRWKWCRAVIKVRFMSIGTLGCSRERSATPLPPRWRPRPLLAMALRAPPVSCIPEFCMAQRLIFQMRPVRFLSVNILRKTVILCMRTIFPASTCTK